MLTSRRGILDAYREHILLQNVLPVRLKLVNIFFFISFVCGLLQIHVRGVSALISSDEAPAAHGTFRTAGSALRPGAQNIQKATFP